MDSLHVLDLFSGIGGFSLGLDRVTHPDGTPTFWTVGFCEQNAYATAVLNSQWPGVPVFGDVRTLGAASLARAGIHRVDVACGGFPCQDISLAGTGAGLDGARSGLWFEMLRIIAETRPRFVIAENVSALRSRGLDIVLGGLASVGYDAEWHCIPASAVGAPHRRDRVWVIAYPQHGGGRGLEQERRADWGDTEFAGHGAQGTAEYVADASRDGLGRGVAAPDAIEGSPERIAVSRGIGAGGAYGPAGSDTGGVWYRAKGPDLADAPGNGWGERGCIVHSLHTTPGGHRPGEFAGNSDDGGGWWITEPDVGRVANGVPSRVDRLRCLGNAVVPQIPEMIGRAILSRIHGVSISETYPA